MAERIANAVWDLLADEHVFYVLRHLRADDLMRVSAVNWRLRHIAFDERLWKALYTVAFPPCPTRCLATVGESVAGVCMFDAVDKGIEHMLDPAWAATGCAVELPQSVCALGDTDVPSSTCPHHWPDVISARGYRWAYAVAAVDRPRLFGPHLDGSPACLVGRSQAYRGDLKPWMWDPIGDGYATCDGMNLSPWERQWESIHARCISGRFSHGAPAGRVVAWCNRADRSVKEDTRNSCVGFYQGDMTGGGPDGLGVLVGPTNGGAPSVIRCGPWRDGSPDTGNHAWSVVGRGQEPKVAGIGYCIRDIGTSGVARTAKGKVAFVGTVESWRPVAGRFLSNNGTVTYEGCAHTARAAVDNNSSTNGGGQRIRRSTLFMGDGRVVGLVGWRGAWDGGPTPKSRQISGLPTITVTYPNGDRMHWHGNPALPTEFVFADGRVCKPALGWNQAAYCAGTGRAENAKPRPRTQLLIQDTPFALPSEHPALSHEYIDSVVFWPRLSAATDARPYACFMDHMAACHGPLWARCRAAACLLWGLDSAIDFP